MNHAKRYKEVVVLFTHFFEQFEIVPNVISYNNLINTHCDEGRVDMAMRVYSHVMYRHLTKGFIHSGRIDKAMDLLREMLNKRQGADSIVYNNLIFEFLNLGNLEKANVLLKYGKKSEAWALFERMLDNHQTPTCFKLRKFSKAIDTFDKIEMHLKSKAFIMDVAGYNNIITQFCENEMLDEAEKLLGEMPTKILPQNFATRCYDFLGILIHAYLKVDRIEDALHLFNQMEDSGLIRGLLNEGQLDLSKDVIDQMTRASVGITLTLHNFVSETFGQVGRGEKIDRFLNPDKWRYTVPLQQPFVFDNGPNQMSEKQSFVPNIMSGELISSPSLLLLLPHPITSPHLSCFLNPHPLSISLFSFFGDENREARFLSSFGLHQVNVMPQITRQSPSGSSLVEGQQQSSHSLRASPTEYQNGAPPICFFSASEQYCTIFGATLLTCTKYYLTFSNFNFQPLWPRVAEQPQPGHYPQEEALQNLSGTLE
ncbi:hypothetical protein ACOSQ4_006574 [Xanthoceras sorbifolium]